jgi:hypothetical protein
MGAFATIVEVMADMNMFQLFFPWLLILSISYGALKQSNVLGDDETVIGVAALAIAFFTIGGAYLFIPAGLFTHFFSAMAFVVFAVIGFVVIAGVAGVDMSQYSEFEGNLPAALGMISFIVLFISILAIYIPWQGLFGGGNLVGAGSIFEEVIMPILILIFLILIVAVTTD